MHTDVCIRHRVIDIQFCMSTSTSCCMKRVNIHTSIFKSCALLFDTTYFTVIIQAQIHVLFLVKGLYCHKHFTRWHLYWFTRVFIGVLFWKTVWNGPSEQFQSIPWTQNGSNIVLRGSSSQTYIHWKWFLFLPFTVWDCQVSKTWQKRAHRERVQSSLLNRKHKSHVTRSLAVNSHPKTS